eukprot:gene18242-20062_t
MRKNNSLFKCSAWLRVLLAFSIFGVSKNLHLNYRRFDQEADASVVKMPGPFERILSLNKPYMAGKDVIIMQNLLERSQIIKVTSRYDEQTAFAVERFQKEHSITTTGVFCPVTARILLQTSLWDGFKDDSHKVPDGYKFKLYVPVHRDRNIETIATLFDAEGKVVYKFKIRARGGTDHDGNVINQLTRNGNTPTGLSTCDLNSKEPDPKSYGPYPVLRVVKGLKGNTAIGYESKTLLSNFRSGILLHTGQWNNWDPSKPMPNSLGCMHCAPSDQKNITDILVNQLGVKVRPNPFGRLPYPYKPQGLIAIEQID